MTAPNQTGVDTEQLKIDRGLQAALACGGALVLCLYWQSWQDTAHLWYDIPAAIAMCGYIAQMICEWRRQIRTPSLRARLCVMIPMSIIPTCRDFFGWPISGHLSVILAVALIQSVDSRLNVWERLAYWLPLPTIVYIRWFVFDRNGHAETLNAFAAAVLMFGSHVKARGIFRAAK